MPQAEKPLVPKFGSFKPKATAQRLDDTKQEPPRFSAGEQRDDDRRPDRKHDHRRPERNLRPERRDPRKSCRDLEEQNSLNVSSALSNPANVDDEFEESELYIVDRRGDRKNVEFGGLHRYSVPPYYRVGYGTVLGASLKVKIDRDESTGNSVVFRFADRSEKQRPKRLLTSKQHGVFAERLQKLILTESGADFHAETDFIPLRPSKKRKRRSEDLAPESAVVGFVDYRSIEGKAKTRNLPDDEDLEFASESDAGESTTTIELKARQQNAALTKYAKDHPHDPESWQALIEHQAQVVCPGATSFTNTEKSAIADIKLSIYDKALRYIQQGLPGHDDLCLGMIECGAYIWENSTLASKWNDVLSESPGSISLWTAYLDFVQTDPSSFRYESCREIYLQCLKVLHDAGSVASSIERASIISVQVYIVLRYTALVRDAGYEELSLSIWQMLLEYHLCRPISASDKTDFKAEFGTFWDSEVPRIGEINSQGWRHHSLHGDGPERQSPETQSDTTNLKVSSKGWAVHELDQIRQLHLPTTPDDDTTLDDPFRHVMFSDLQPVLETTLDGISNNGLINAFLLFMHMPILPDIDSIAACQSWQSDQYLQTPNASTISLNASEDEPFRNQQVMVYDLFRDGFKSLPTPGDTRHAVANAVPRFVDRILETAVAAEPKDDAVSEYLLAFKLHFFPDEVCKAAKRLLKSRPTSSRLYNAYALIEAKLGRPEKARDVWTAASTMCRQSGERAGDEILLRHSNVLSSLDSRREKEALQCLLSRPLSTVEAANLNEVAETVSSTEKLRATQNFLHGWAVSLDQRHFGRAVLYTECSALLAYLLQPNELDAALALFKPRSYSLLACQASAATESLHQAKARLLNLHMTQKRPYKPARLREELVESLHLFPENTLLRTLFTQNEAHFVLHDRIRTSLQSQLLGFSNISLATWSHHIADELHAFKNGSPGSTANSVRATFVRALMSNDSAAAHSATLWMQWLRFELPGQCSQTAHHILSLSREDDETAGRRTKQVFFDGLRFMPWYKPWVIFGLAVLMQSDVIQQREVRRVIGVLEERELRVRGDLGWMK